MQRQDATSAPPAPDLTKGYPRSGRDILGGFAWLGRMADKARAKQAGTLGGYISLCPLDRRFLRRCGVNDREFWDLIKHGESDEKIAEYFNQRVPLERREAANTFVLRDKARALNAQDREEGRAC